jgi:leader peptidase (prepilin peptidase)/N-methyltransferase
MTAAEALWPFVAMLAALPIGSFAALLADRLPRGQAVLLARSRCRSCGQRLCLRDLIPIVSWVRLRGRCRDCGATIGIDPLLGEALALGIAMASVAALPSHLVWPACLLGWALLALGLADLRHFMLPDVITLPLLVCGLVLAAFRAGGMPQPELAGTLAGGLFFALMLLSYRRLRQRDGLGWGDVKLLAAGGAWVGWEALPLVVAIAALLTLSVVPLLGSGLRGEAAGPQPIPFGPGLAVAIWVIFVFENSAYRT